MWFGSLDRRGWLRLRDLLSKLVQTVADRRVENQVADAKDYSPEDFRIHAARDLDLAVDLLSDLAEFFQATLAPSRRCQSGTQR